MLRSLSSRFRTREEEVARPHYLDTNSLAIPDLAIHALRMELSRTQGFAVAALAAANRLPPDEASVEHETSALQALAPRHRQLRAPAERRQPAARPRRDAGA